MTDLFANRLKHVREIAQKRWWYETFEPEYIHPIMRPCTVNILVVTDGALDFNLGNGGLRTFVESLKNNQPTFSRFRITVAHLSNHSGAAIMEGEDAVVRSIGGFKFDDTDHFTPDMYDVVFLFGHATSYNRPNYPPDRLGDGELEAIEGHMARGGGVFATGDHGFIGRALCACLPRVGSMRLWAPTDLNDNDVDEVSMTGARRNDTNRPGVNGQFDINDQSDDVPQVIRPRMYRAYGGLWRYEFPHPVLCGSNGVIDVLPDHPHEGECVVPSSPSMTEYPEHGGVRPLPEIIAWSDVVDGADSGNKTPADGHAFGAICAYDGHRADVGRVVTDATWHHFVNMNLVGVGFPAGTPTETGFLFSASGQAALDKIIDYYVNLAIWLSPPETISCIRVRQLWFTAFHERAMEAVLTYPKIKVNEAKASWLWKIGKHARDAFGKATSACQSRELALWAIRPWLEHELEWVSETIDPWWPRRKLTRAQLRRQQEILPFVNMEPMLDVAFGGAIAALTERFSIEDRDKVKDEDIMKVAAEGARVGLELGSRSFSAGMRDANRMHRALGRAAASRDR